MGGTIVREGAAPAEDSGATPSGRRDLQIETVVTMLHVDLGDAVSTELLEERVRVAFAAFNDAPIRDFVPILVRTSVRRELRGHLPAGPVPSADGATAAVPSDGVGSRRRGFSRLRSLRRG